MSSWTRFIRDRSKRLDPLPTGEEPRFDPLPGIEAVVFDVYGTLIVSGCGDISLVQSSDGSGAFAAALAECGIKLPAERSKVDALFRQAISDQQQATGHEFPEVDIVAVWRDFVARLVDQQAIDAPARDLDWEQMALTYEMQVNPVWPMPGCAEICQAIAASGRKLGIVSNAQFFTPYLFEGLCGQSLFELGFESDHCVWSYQHLQAKPGTFLYEQSASRFAEVGISPELVLYIGNDMRNDVMPAAKVGFRTVLFAGDERSLRLRQDDPAVTGVVPDRVVTDLRQIIDILHLAHA